MRLGRGLLLTSYRTGDKEFLFNSGNARESGKLSAGRGGNGGTVQQREGGGWAFYAEMGCGSWENKELRVGWGWARDKRA